MENVKKMMPSEEKKFMNGYAKEASDIEMPNDKVYNFLLERNKNYMNYTALSFDKKKITYEELHTRIDEYARALYKRGVREKDIIGVCLANNPESIYLLYALNKLGAIVVGLSPLNNEYKMKRDIEISKPKFVITADMMYKKFRSIEDTLDFTPILYSPVESMSNPILKTIYKGKQFIDGNRVVLDSQKLSKIIKNGKKFSDIYYPEYHKGEITDIMFTGGSTGVHKGVDLDENGLNSVVKSLDYVLTLEPGMKHLGNIPFGHMAFGRLVMHYALCKNLEFALTLNMLPDKFLDELIRTQADGAMGGPVHWNTLINNPKIIKGCLSNLKQALSGGEMYIPDQRKAANAELKKAGSPTEIGDGLGLTETWAPVSVCMAGKNTPDTVGYMIPGSNAKVVDPDTYEEVERNKAGLLLVDSPGMMLGYHENKEETDKVFVYDNGIKWYNTGDIVTRLDTDEIKFAGRRKRNFVCGVDNIYPEQIESLVSNLNEVAEIVVTKIPDEEYQNLPKYHIRLSDQLCDIKSIEEKIEMTILSTLGESALPGYIEYHQKSLPRTDNGKLNASFLEQQDIKNLNSGKQMSYKRK